MIGNGVPSRHYASEREYNQIEEITSPRGGLSKMDLFVLKPMLAKLKQAGAKVSVGSRKITIKFKRSGSVLRELRPLLRALDNMGLQRKSTEF